MGWLKWAGAALLSLVALGAAAAAYGASRWSKGTRILRKPRGIRPRCCQAKACAAAPWQGRFWDHGMRSGMRVPLQAEVAWDLPHGLSTYFRGTSTALACELAE
jgi:hypothetical protein